MSFDAFMIVKGCGSEGGAAGGVVDRCVLQRVEALRGFFGRFVTAKVTGVRGTSSDTTTEGDAVSGHWLQQHDVERAPHGWIREQAQARCDQASPGRGHRAQGRVGGLEPSVFDQPSSEFLGGGVAQVEGHILHSGCRARRGPPALSPGTAPAESESVFVVPALRSAQTCTIPRGDAQRRYVNAGASYDLVAVSFEVELGEFFAI